MKLKSYLGRSLFVTFLLGALACNSKKDKINDDTHDNMGGAPSDLTDELDALRREIEALKAQLDNLPPGEDTSDLEAALQDALDRLAELETCETRGDCNALSESRDALLPLTDAYCDWIFSCCSDDEARATLGAALRSVEQCKDTYGSMLGRANASFYLPIGDHPGLGERAYLVSRILSDAGAIASLLEKGTLAINTARVAGCASYIEGGSCAEDGGVSAESCSGVIPEQCTGLFEGSQVSGGVCFADAECDEGLLCDGHGSGYGYGLGIDLSSPSICVPEPQEDDPCVSNDDCRTLGETLYCDREEGICQGRPGLGETCEFRDPTFSQYSHWSFSIPCAQNLVCSAESKTCVASCEAGSPCDQWGTHYQCSAGLVCNRTTVQLTTNLSSSYGFCDEPAAGGEIRNYNNECAAGWRNDGSCVGVGGEECGDEFDCASGNCLEGSSTCSNYCGGGRESICSSTQFCNGWECSEKGDEEDGCNSDNECTSDICYEGQCVLAVASGASCAGNGSGQCPSDEYCEFTEEGDTGYICLSRLNLGADCGDASQGACPDGSVCDGNDGATCLPDAERAAGAYCSHWSQCASQRCDYLTDTCRADGLAAGAACTTDVYGQGSHVSDPSMDQCLAGFYCKRSAPGSVSDFAGICTAQVEPGRLCNTSALNQAQCIGNQYCVYSYGVEGHVCPVVQTESCMLETPGEYGYGYGIGMF